MWVFFVSLSVLLCPQLLNLSKSQTMTDTQTVETLAQELAQRLGGMGKEVLTSDEAAAYLGMSKSHLYKLTMSRQIPHYKPQGKRCYFNRAELLEWVQQGRVATVDELNVRALEIARKGGAR